MPAISKSLQILAEQRNSSCQPVPAAHIDTTTIYFDRPIWDDAELRKDLLDSDEEHYLDGDPPSYIGDNESVLEEIIKSTKHDYFSNPLEHTHQDETILVSDDEFDYSNVNLGLRRQQSAGSPEIEKRRLDFANAPFQGSLDTS
ncbi:unnamed protein product [Caenorhabditis auriculariae]|uniref:Uncharacterized protein n=1 Tax=Caenorhabditis auriculariae TaxID=2777116 RepID=A0A8S1GPP7_9PELO|nr:unnamed protein product [Caenorhabditis auriculariae]